MHTHYVVQVAMPFLPLSLQLEDHLNPRTGDCPLADIPCPFKPYGCTFVVSIHPWWKKCVYAKGREEGGKKENLEKHTWCQNKEQLVDLSKFLCQRDRGVRWGVNALAKDRNWDSFQTIFQENKFRVCLTIWGVHICNGLFHFMTV